MQCYKIGSFTISLESIWLIVDNQVLLYRPCLFCLASPPICLLPCHFFYDKKKPCRNKSQKSFCKENKCMQGWNPQKPTKQDGNDTTILSKQTRSCILYHFANNEHHKVYCIHISLFIPTKCITIYTSTTHSALLTPQPSIMYKTLHICVYIMVSFTSCLADFWAMVPSLHALVFFNKFIYGFSYLCLNKFRHT